MCTLPMLAVAVRRQGWCAAQAGRGNPGFKDDARSERKPEDESLAEAWDTFIDAAEDFGKDACPSGLGEDQRGRCRHPGRLQGHAEPSPPCDAPRAYSVWWSRVRLRSSRSSRP